MHSHSNQGDRLDPRTRSHSFKGTGRPPAEAPTARGQDTPAGAGDPQKVWRQGNSCLPCMRAFQRSEGPSTAQRERSVKTPGRSLGFPGSFHRSACAAKLLSTTWTPGSRPAGLLGGQVGPPTRRQDHLLSTQSLVEPNIDRPQNTHAAKF
ncbi:hypothetical protein MG293_009100 [Ovis ammon polii]|uniref:Uncharacterized protein n=1 Tax=Ovis ammon polii TaxID=230172 RepID=A0AAD4U8N6_OVIAM|nr:hypothetical protein MG293_009100 [Ovis ammon polii]KAI4567732.1 hypothetical protein MJT46_007530 [Ovis ammon polii x Ovis aries]